MLSLQTLSEREQRICHGWRMPGGAQVTGIVVSAIHHDSLVAVHGVDILVASNMNARDFGSAALAVHEIDGLPNAAFPRIIADSEGASQGASRFDGICSGLAGLGEIEDLVCPQWCGHLLDRFCENCLPCLLVND